MLAGTVGVMDGGGRVSDSTELRTSRVPAVTPLESRGFSAEASRVAEHESWRKELHRPATYVHKWWARRLGSVFRQTLLAAVGAKEGPESAAALTGVVVYDPFAGSGTTLVEAVKLGARVIGIDINPVATLTQRQAFRAWRPTELSRLFEVVERQCRDDIARLYVTESGAPVLHYFWVALASCPTCAEDVELFSSYVFAKHAYPKRHPIAHATCPSCHAVCPLTLGADEKGYCGTCDSQFSLIGPVRARSMTCSQGHRSAVLEALGQQAPRRRMYAKMVLGPEGRRQYQNIDPFDLDLYDQASKLLADATDDDLVVPDGFLAGGTNTRQALNWGYSLWASFFNDRQLYCLGRIGAALRDLPTMNAEREALIAAFGKTLEHHNVFCSFKGEGTGPVRSIFHNHVLRPERCSVEGNPWGAHGGSGGYADALDRLETAASYKAAPTDLALVDGHVETITGHSQALNRPVVRNWAAFERTAGSAYVLTGDGGATDLPSRSVSLVITDPPFVDNVNYSELADFYHAWMRQMRPYPGYSRRASTRDAQEVQNQHADDFGTMITEVWRECSRVLRDDGLLAFSFHQSETQGWASLMRSLSAAGFVVTATRPVVAEVTTSLSKVPAAAPNRIDVIVSCRKQASCVPRVIVTPAQARAKALRGLSRIHDAGLELGAGDVLSAVRAAVLATGTAQPSPDWAALAAATDTQAHLALEAFLD